MATKLEQDMNGYNRYRQKLGMTAYSDEMLRKLLEHSEQLLDKYPEEKGSQARAHVGIAFTDKLLIPLSFPGAVMDESDVFAAVYLKNYNFRVDPNLRAKYYLYVLLTNDELYPILPMVHIQRVSILGRLLKRIPNDMATELEKRLTALKYPVCDIEQFENLIRTEYRLQGRLNKNMVISQLYDAKNQIGLFNAESISAEFGGLTREMLTRHGYRAE